jgi:AraC-like DNA-binding protein
MKILIKNMVCDRCKMVIQNVLDELELKPQAPQKVKLSEYLSNQLHHDYTHLSNLFSTVEGVTIEQYFINQKIEKTRELLVYDELTLTQISYRLGYSSVAHLSRQFKKITGMAPSQFKQLRDSNQRQSLDKV